MEKKLVLPAHTGRTSNMKKLIAIVLAALMLLSLTACGETADTAASGTTASTGAKLRFVTGGESGTY